VNSRLTALDVVLATNPVAPTDPALFSVAGCLRSRPKTRTRRRCAALEEHLAARGTTGAVLERALTYYDGMDPKLCNRPSSEQHSPA
jgi:hypothetical protein